MAILGRRLIVKFVEEINPTQFEDWENAISKGSIKASNANLVSSTTNISETNAAAAIISQQIQQIPDVGFQAIAQELAPTIMAVDIKNANQGISHPNPKNLPPALAIALERVGITTIFDHQLEALTKLCTGFDLSITTPTASGKTLCYNLPIIKTCIEEPQTTALYIFPLKALALDQMRKLNHLVSDSSNKNGAGDVSVKFGQPLNQLNYSFSQVDTPTHPELVPGGMRSAFRTSIKGCPNLRSQFNGFYEETHNTQQINHMGFKPAPFLEGDIVKAIPGSRIKIALMTGDTPFDERQKLFIPNPPNILAVSPDLLHHYLYNVRRREQGEGWRLFLKQLRWIVIDESHTGSWCFWRTLC